MNIDRAVTVSVGAVPVAAGPGVPGDPGAAVFSALLAAAVPGVSAKGAVLAVVAVGDDRLNGVALLAVPAGGMMLPEPAIVQAATAGTAAAESVIPTPVAGEPGVDHAELPQILQSVPLAAPPVRVAKPVAPDLQGQDDPVMPLLPDELPVAGDMVPMVPYRDRSQVRVVALPEDDKRLIETGAVAEIVPARVRPGPRLSLVDAPALDDDDPVDAVEVAGAVIPAAAALAPVVFQVPVSQGGAAAFEPDHAAPAMLGRAVDIGRASSNLPAGIRPARLMAGSGAGSIDGSVDGRQDLGEAYFALPAPQKGKPALVVDKPAVVPLAPAGLPALHPIGALPAPVPSAQVPATDLASDWRLRRVDVGDAAVPVSAGGMAARLAPLAVADMPAVPQHVPVIAPQADIAVASESLGDVRIGLEGTARDLKVSIGLAPGAAAIVAADVPRLVADLAANGVRLQSLDVSGGGQFGGASQGQRENLAQRENPGHALQRQMPMVNVPAAPRARDRYA